MCHCHFHYFFHRGCFFCQRSCFFSKAFFRNVSSRFLFQSKKVFFKFFHFFFKKFFFQKSFVFQFFFSNSFFPIFFLIRVVSSKKIVCCFKKKLLFPKDGSVFLSKGFFSKGIGFQFFEGMCFFLFLIDVLFLLLQNKGTFFPECFFLQKVVFFSKFNRFSFQFFSIFFERFLISKEFFFFKRFVNKGFYSLFSPLPQKCFFFQKKLFLQSFF